MNSGDWVESLTALVEDHKGNWELLHFLNEHDFDLEDEYAEEVDDEAFANVKGVFMSVV